MYSGAITSCAKVQSTVYPSGAHDEKYLVGGGHTDFIYFALREKIIHLVCKCF